MRERNHHYHVTHEHEGVPNLEFVRREAALLYALCIHTEHFHELYGGYSVGVVADGRAVVDLESIDRGVLRRLVEHVSEVIDGEA